MLIFIAFMYSVNIYPPMFRDHSILFGLSFDDTKDSPRFTSKWIPPGKCIYIAIISDFIILPHAAHLGISA